MDTKISQRDFSIDLLRFIALAGIIIAHIEPSPFWIQLRNFDVPLMVFLSGVSYRLSGGNRQGYWSYAEKRFMRLVLPVWVFLSMYVALYACIYGELLPTRILVEYYSLLTSWYVWIIRVFFVIALVSPLFSPILDRIGKRKTLWLIGAFLSLFEIYLSSRYAIFRGSTIALMNISYMAVFMIGYKIDDFSKKEILKIACAFLGVYICYVLYYCFITGEYLPTQEAKYPPRLYYLSYAMTVSLVLWITKDSLYQWLQKTSERLTRLVTYIGSHTIWIYLWHIPLLSLAKHIDSIPLRFWVVYLFAFLIACIQAEIVLKLTGSMPDSKWKRNLRMVLIG